MASSNPFIVPDLVHKYGWDFLGYMANLGVNLPGNGQVFFVDSNATEASDVDDANHGHLMHKPLATLDYAIGLCTDGQGDVIILAPGHAETLIAATSCVVDKSDLTIVGLGTGLNRPKFSFGTATTATISVTSANVTIKNIQIASALANVAIGVTVGASAAGFWVEDCLFTDGGTATTELVIGLSLAAECDDVTVLNCTFQTVTGGGCSSAIFATAGNDRLRIEGCHSYGYYTAANIDANATTLHAGINIKDNVLVNMHATGNCIELYTGTSGTVVRNMVGHTSGTIDEAIDGDDGVYLFENYEVDAVAVSAILIPAALAQ